MSGFFKKLFNRVIGKTEQPAPPPAEEIKALPEPEPEAIAAEPVPEPDPVVEDVPAPAEPEPVAEERGHSTPAAEPEIETPAEVLPPPVTPPRKQKEPPPPKPAAKKAKAEPEAPAIKPKAKAAPPPPPSPPPKKKAKAEAAAPPPKKKIVREEPPPPPPKKPKVKAPPPPPPPPAKKAKEKEKTPPVAAPPEIAVEEAPPPSPPKLEVPPEEPVVLQAPPAPVVEEIAPPPVEPDLPKAGQLRATKPAEPVAEPEPEPVARRGWLSRLKDGLSKSSRSITGSISSIFTKRKLDRATLDELEDVLIQADLGLPVSERIVAAVSAGRYDKEIEPEEVKRILAEEVAKVLKPVEVPFNFGSEKPFVILVVGVNGAGKTTTIGKLGAIAAGEGYKVMFAACDTFRAAAIEQLTVWGQRTGAKVMSRPTGADSSGLAFDAMKEAKATGTDILFIDTAGRLQNKAYLMDELDKIVRVVKKQDETAPHAVLLVLDATTGQNAMAQAEVFTKVAGVTGLIMTKLDGTARGGILVAIAEKFKLPVHAIGVGESIDDLQPFEAEAFARAIAGLEVS
ncbi:signal recognition particle-docking protein FtsY [Aestuariivirga sp.]|uniref:signal recognition particle-docking protein FtsY n=1 Tax=Aestuariivirga sp. TaxID=2650926 RepID=UPI0039E4524A